MKSRLLLKLTLIIPIIFLLIPVFLNSIANIITTNNANQTYILEEAFPNLSLNNPVDFQSPDDDSNRIFIVEQRGTIKVFNNSAEETKSSIFLDISTKVLSGGERGLLGLAFHPDFEQHQSFFVYYTESSNGDSVISRFNISSTNSNQADTASELILLTIAQPFSNHNGGSIAFGLDGYLYIGLGDGGSGGDPHGNGQNLQTLLGSILRIDVDVSNQGKNYSIPVDNPFIGNVNGYQEEIFAYGLRNPWRFSFDSETGDLWTGDVGQGAKEEIDLIKSGKNYGWNIMEGNSCYSPSTGCAAQTNLELPVFDYGRSEGTTVTGGYVYHGLNVPSLNDLYIYGDFGSGRIWSLDNTNEKVVNTELTNTDISISAFGTDQNNEIYILDYSGKIYKFSSELGQSTTAEPNTSNHSSNTSDVSGFSGFILLFAISLSIFYYRYRRVKK